MFSFFRNSIEVEYETLKQKCLEQDAELSLKNKEIQELNKERQSLLDQLHINQLAFQKEKDSLDKLRLEQINILNEQVMKLEIENEKVNEQKEVDRQSLLDQLRDEQKEKREREENMKKRSIAILKMKQMLRDRKISKVR
jgi:hypothetical protein